MDNDQSQNNRGGYGLLIIPILMASGLIFVGWVVARAGASYRATKIALYPAAFFLANVLSVMPFICIGWLIALIIGNREMANYVVGKASELCLLSQAFGDPITVPPSHIILYQLVVWWFVMRPLSDVMTTVIYNSAQPESVAK